MSELTFLAGLGLAGIAAVLGATLPGRARRVAAAGATAVACLVELLASGAILATGHTWRVHSAAVLPLTGVDLSLDPLGALFVATTAAVGVAAAIYQVGYAGHGDASRTVTATLPLFVGSLLLVPAAASVATLLAAWELMAVTSLVLVLTGHDDPATRRAGQWYAAMTHAGAACILLAFVVLASHAGGQSFAAIAAGRAHVSAGLRSTVFVLALAGFSSKAGAVPLHVWLPRAHPQAPSPVSALMSGSMVNLGVYGIVRLGDGLLGGGPAWWWLLVLGLGVASAVFGALHASTSTDLKRLLAYSTVDNLGLVLVGVGVAGILVRGGYGRLGALALLAALFHLANHSLFKGCLFLGAGAVQQASGTRDLDHLGGLARRLPTTAALFGIGALAIAALPPLNGFASEWLLFEGLLHGFADHAVVAVVALLAGVAALALAGGLTAVAVVKAVGIGFLGQPRSGGAARASEVAPSMRTGMALLAAGCVALGVLPGAVLPELTRATASALSSAAGTPLRPGLGLDLAGLEGAVAPALLLVGLLAAGLAAWTAVRALGHRSRLPVRRAPVWGCGGDEPTARMQHTATSFAEPLQRVFADVLRPDHDLEVTHASESRYFPKAIAYRQQIEDGIERSLYGPLVEGVSALGRLARRIPNGSVHRYLAFGLAALVLVLAVLG